MALELNWRESVSKKGKIVPSEKTTGREDGEFTDRFLYGLMKRFGKKLIKAEKDKDWVNYKEFGDTLSFVRGTIHSRNKEGKVIYQNRSEFFKAKKKYFGYTEEERANIQSILKK